MPLIWRDAATTSVVELFVCSNCLNAIFFKLRIIRLSAIDKCIVQKEKENFKETTCTWDHMWTYYTHTQNYKRYDELWHIHAYVDTLNGSGHYISTIIIIFCYSLDSKNKGMGLNYFFISVFRMYFKHYCTNWFTCIFKGTLFQEPYFCGIWVSY